VRQPWHDLGSLSRNRYNNNVSRILRKRDSTLSPASLTCPRPPAFDLASQRG